MGMNGAPTIEAPKNIFSPPPPPPKKLPYKKEEVKESESGEDGIKSFLPLAFLWWMVK